MDLLFKRYASPFLLLDSLISCNRLFDFIKELVDLNNDEEIYNLWLHKVFDKTYPEFRSEVLENSKVNNISDQAVETTIKDSLDILNNFSPKER